MIVFSQGDKLSLVLTCTGHDLTGATITTIFKSTTGADVIIPAGQHTIDADQVTNKGKFSVALTALDTAGIASGNSQSVIAKIVQASTTIHFHGTGILTVKKSTLV